MYTDSGRTGACMVDVCAKPSGTVTILGVKLLDRVIVDMVATIYF